MTEPKNQQQVTVPLTDESSFGADIDRSYMDDDVASDETRNSRGELTNTGEAASSELSHQGTSYTGTCDNSDFPESRHSTLAFFLRLLAIFSCCSDDNKSAPVSRVAGEVQPAIDEFIAGRRQSFEKLFGKELSAEEENNIRQQLADWNTFLQRKQGEWITSAVISLDIKEDIHKYIESHLLNGEQWTEGYKKPIIRCLQQWNKFLQARADEKLVTGCGIFFTVTGLFFFLLDLVSDISTSIFYACKEQWWQAILTLVIVYGSIIIHTVMNWLSGLIHCTGTADWLRYISSLLVNWPGMKQYWVLCLLEWKLYKSPENNARLVPEWHKKRFNVAFLKIMEGVCEACPQAILQLYLLAPDLYGDLTWTEYFRILSTCISLCMAGAALTNFEKCRKIIYNNDLPILPTRQLVVLHVWAVPVTVSRLLSVALLLTEAPYWGLAGVVLHFTLCTVYWCITNRGLRELNDVFAICQFTLLFFISPFNVTGSITYRYVVHAIHFLGNTVATVVWTLGTPLAYSHPALYTTIICFNAVMFVLGLLGWVLYTKYWPYSFL